MIVVLLSEKIDWQALDRAFGYYFTDSNGAPALRAQLIVGLKYLKHVLDHSNEDVVALWIKNYYWQYLCGECIFQYRLPCTTNSLTNWRNSRSEAGCEWLLSISIQTSVDTQTVNLNDFQSITVDRFVQENVASSTTLIKLCELSRYLVKLSRRYGRELQQNFNRKPPYIISMDNPCHGSQQMKRKYKLLKQMKNLAGREQCVNERQLQTNPEEVRSALDETLAKTRRISNQQRQNKDKFRICYTPEVKCIPKGKVYKKYKFGLKVGITVTHHGIFVLGTRSFPGNPYVGHTLMFCPKQTVILIGVRAKEVFVDLGYWGATSITSPFTNQSKNGILTRDGSNAR